MKDSKSEVTHLVKRGDLHVFLQEKLDEQKLKITDLEKVLPFVESSDLKKVMTRQLSRAKEISVALEAGFVPVSGGWFWKVDENLETKSRWTGKWVREVVKTMPEEVKIAFERVKKLGIFESYGVMGAKQGDPMLIGRTGGKAFLLANWINFEGGIAVGFIVRAGQ